MTIDTPTPGNGGTKIIMAENVSLPPDEVPIIGDGVVSIVNPEGAVKMAMDLPDGVGQLMMTETAANVQASNRNSRGVFDTVMGALAGVVETNFKDIGVLEGRTASGVMATPLASPVMQVK